VSDLERLLRWEKSGGTWRVRGGTGSLTVALCRCDGGEEVDRFASTDPALLRYVGVRRSSEETSSELAD
jgi:hypothetical protein